MKLKGEVENLLQVSNFHRLCRISAHPYQLRSLVEHGLSQPELRQILGQMRAMAPPPTSVTQQPARSHAPPPPVHPPYEQSAVSVPPPILQAPRMSQPVAAPTPPASFDVARIQGLLSALTKVGTVTTTPQPTINTSSQAASSSTSAPIDPSTAEADKRRVATRIYRQRVLSRSAKLNSVDIVKFVIVLGLFTYSNSAA
jgi:pre-mRNA cleavage complex 2 protein Pcf11